MMIKRVYPFFLMVLCAFLFVSTGYTQLPPADTIDARGGAIIIQPVFHGAVVLKLGDKTIYVDPYNGSSAYKSLETPDLVLITDIHQDHLDTVTLNAINLSGAKLVVPQAVADQLPSRYKDKVTALHNGNSLEMPGISITAVPMYDLPETATARHTKGRGNGYILTYGGKRIYISGDTDDIPEMRALQQIDIAFICMNQPFTMTVQQAASAVLEFKPAIVYPYHYRDMNGFSDIEAFKKIVLQGSKGIDVRIRNWYGKSTPSVKAKKYENVVYGMVSGASLTMDIYQPERSNRIGIIAVPGTAYGYAYSPEYNQSSMTENFSRDSLYFGKYALTLVEKGYTIFVINHRLAPAFRYTDILGDCQRAVRFIRFNASRYGIDPEHIGAFGYSSGATLCAMLGVTEADNNINQAGADAVSSKVQSVVTLAARFDLSDFNKRVDTAILNPIITRVLFNYIGELPMVVNNEYVLSGKYAEASPLTFVDRGDASFLIYGSFDDPLVPYRQQVSMYKKLTGSGIAARLIAGNKGGHFPVPDPGEIDNWFMQQLKFTHQ